MFLPISMSSTEAELIENCQKKYVICNIKQFTTLIKLKTQMIRHTLSFAAPDALDPDKTFKAGYDKNKTIITIIIN